MFLYILAVQIINQSNIIKCSYNIIILLFSMLMSSEICIILHVTKKTGSQAVARIADRIASQHLCESRDVVRHVTI